MPIIPAKFYCLNADWIHLVPLKDRTFEQTVGDFCNYVYLRMSVALYTEK